MSEYQKKIMKFAGKNVHIEFALQSNTDSGNESANGKVTDIGEDYVELDGKAVYNLRHVLYIIEK
jgi:hypothetical protein